MKTYFGMMLLFLVTINVFNANLLGTRKEKNCENPCSVCQKTIYKLKFHKQADCGASRCKSTVKINFILVLKSLGTLE